MKKVLLDCGAHLGQGLKHLSKLKKIDETWEIHSWEANPYTFKELLSNLDFKYKVNFHNEAVSNYDGFIKINIETTKQKRSNFETDLGQGSSIIPLNQWDGGLHIGKFVKTENVKCLDLSEWIKKNYKQNDYIVIKLDIEGAEYDLLEKMILDCTINYVNEFYIEWHSRFFVNQEEILERESNIKRTIKHLMCEYIGPK